MKINLSNTSRVQEALDHGQKGMRAGVFTTLEVKSEVDAAEYALAEAGIPVSLRQGATVIAHARVGTKHWPAATTVVFLERGALDWFLTDVVRDEAWDEPRVRIYPPKGFNLIAHARRVLRGAGVSA